MVNEQYARAKNILFEHKEGHNELAQLLIDKEVIFAEDVEHIFGKRPWASRSEEIITASKSTAGAKVVEEGGETFSGEFPNATESTETELPDSDTPKTTPDEPTGESESKN